MRVSCSSLAPPKPLTSERKARYTTFKVEPLNRSVLAMKLTVNVSDIQVTLYVKMAMPDSQDYH